MKMFQKKVLLAAVLAAGSSTAFAATNPIPDNESIVQQVDGDTSTVLVEQQASATPDLGGQFSQVVQQGTSGSSARVYQGVGDAAGGLIDASGNDFTTNIDGYGDAVDIGSALAAATAGGSMPYTYASLDTTSTNYVTILQDSTTNSQASVYQTSAADDLTAVADGVSLADGGNLDFSAGAISITDGALPGFSFTYNVGDFAVAGLTNANNAAVLLQGGQVFDRGGNVLFGTAANDGADSEAAIIVQSGEQQVAQIYQSGAGQAAAILQENMLNNGFIAQGGDTNTAVVGQFSTNGLSTVYQNGTTNTVVAFQYN